MKQKLLLVAALFFGVLAFILTYYQIKIERDKALGAARNVTLTPHMAGGSNDAFFNSPIKLGSELAKHLRGEPCRGKIK